MNKPNQSKTPRTDDSAREISEWLRKQPDIEVVATGFARQLETELAELQHFKDAYSRALNFVREQRFASLPMKPADDKFFLLGSVFQLLRDGYFGGEGEGVDMQKHEIKMLRC